ncbi:Leucine-rich_repeat protein [Hexamita inflata]|uniref:Leucine-rich repeat protein n=1 Tax=Hexamita inflata TaxID=28002 RepID=A0AA86RUT2_9EUKA|nr:Leucine-rich repeat protein [Hexamita inflata]
MSYLPDGSRDRDEFEITELNSSTELPKTAQVLQISNSTISHDQFVKILKLPYLTNLIVMNCTLDITFSKLPKVNRLQTLMIVNCGLTEFPDLSFSKFLQYLVLDNNKIKEISNLSLEFLLEFSICSNQLDTVVLALPSLLSLKLSKNRISSDAFVCGVPSLTSLDISNNIITQFQHLSATNCPYISQLSCTHNPLKINSFKSVVSCQFMTSINISQIPDLDLNVLRTEILGEFMSRSDEVAGAVGKNTFDDIFRNCLSFDHQEFQKLKRDAIDVMVQPEDLTKVLITGLFGQIIEINGQQMDIEDKVKMKNWICPRAEYLGMCAVKQYE